AVQTGLCLARTDCRVGCRKRAGGKRAELALKREPGHYNTYLLETLLYESLRDSTDTPASLSPKDTYFFFSILIEIFVLSPHQSSCFHEEKTNNFRAYYWW